MTEADEVFPRLVMTEDRNLRGTASMNGRMTLGTLIYLTTKAKNQGAPDASFVELKFDSKVHTDGNGVTTFNLEFTEQVRGAQLRLDEGAS
jgi:hypothetical protein